MVASLEEAQQRIATQAQQITTLLGQVQILQGSLETAQATIQKQRYQLDLYLDRLYGRKSEHYHPDQLRMDFLLLQGLRTTPDDPAAAPAAAEVGAQGVEATPAATPARPRRHTPHGRLPIPEHLERVVVELDIPENDRRCPRTGQPMVCIGHEDSEKLEWEPGRFYCLVYRRAK